MFYSESELNAFMQWVVQEVARRLGNHDAVWYSSSELADWIRDQNADVYGKLIAFLGAYQLWYQATAHNIAIRMRGEQPTAAQIGRANELIGDRHRTRAELIQSLNALGT